MVHLDIPLAVLATFQHVLYFDQAYITLTDRWTNLYVLPDCYYRPPGMVTGSKILFLPGKAVYLAVW